MTEIDVVPGVYLLSGAVGLVVVTAIGLVLGGESVGLRIAMGIVALIVLGLLGLWQLRRRGAGARAQVA